LLLIVYLLQLRDAVEKRNKELHTLEKRINEITDRIYKEFSKSVGVANIREYEENRLKDAQSLQEERLKLSSQLSKLKYQCVPSSLFFFNLFILILMKLKTLNEVQPFHFTAMIFYSMLLIIFSYIYMGFARIDPLIFMKVYFRKVHLFALD